MSRYTIKVTRQGGRLLYTVCDGETAIAQFRDRFAAAEYILDLMERAR